MYNPLSIELVILQHLMSDVAYANKYLPKMDGSFFTSVVGGSILFDEIASYVIKYQKAATVQEISIQVGQRKGKIEGAIETLDKLAVPIQNPAWLKDKTEKHIIEKTQYNVTLELIQDPKNSKLIATCAQKLLNPPTFEDTMIDSSHPDFFERMVAYNSRQDVVIPFDLDCLNRAIHGVQKQTLNIALAATSVGKSMFMCHLSAAYMRQGLNVLYITMEMSTGVVYNRIYANLLDHPLESDGVLKLTQAEISTKATAADKLGRLLAKSYITGAAHTGDFRSYISEMKQKGFVPDVVMVDYLNICSSERLKAGSNTANYQMVGSVAKELRSLAQQSDVVLWSATQANRQGLKGQLGIGNTSDSIQIAYDADLILSLWRDETIPDRLHASVEKNRNGVAGSHVMLAVVPAKMRLYDMTAAQTTHYQQSVSKLQKGKSKPVKSVKAGEEPVFDIDVIAA